MLEPISNHLASQAARKVALSDRAKQARASEKANGAKRGADSFDSALEGVEAAEAVRRLADADQEEAREDREASQLRHGREQAGQGGPLDLEA